MEITNVKLKNIDLPAMNVFGRGPALKEWCSEHKTQILSHVQEHGAFLTRGWKINHHSQFRDISNIIFSGDLLPYKNGSTPRTELGEGVYTSTEYPNTQFIPLHNENSYTGNWARYIAFFCLSPSSTGGETPIADSCAVYDGIDKDVRAEFESKGLMYVRNFGSLDLSWEETFGTNDKVAVGNFCKENNIKYEWEGEGEGEGLCTREVRPAIIRHPETQKPVWFNQAHLFHISSHAEDIRISLERACDGKYPRNVYFGDGSEIDVEALNHVRDVYQKSKNEFEWKAGDILILDNMRFAHGRNPYTGSRKVLVSMSSSVSSSI